MKQKILFGMEHLGFLRNFESVIVTLLKAGIDVHLNLSNEHRSIKISDYDIPTDLPGCLTMSKWEYKTPNTIYYKLIRLLRDTLHYSNPAFKNAAHLRERIPGLMKLSVKNRKRFVRLFDFIPNFLKKKLEWLSRKLESYITPSDKLITLVRDLKPNYIIVTPLVHFGSNQEELVKVAQILKIPTLLATASWDNLTNKRRIMVQPDHVAVWNNAMAEEAKQLHNVPSHKLWITGAPLFDNWFERSPSLTKEDFCSLLNFDPALPIVTYLCSTVTIAKAEHNIVKLWRDALIKAGNKLAKVNILVRPHPLALECWQTLFPENNSEIAEMDGITVWPFNAKHPTTEQTRDAFFNTLFYSDAIVGLNTSAMIEAAILGKPVLTFGNHDAFATQTENLHFKHLINGGFLSFAEDLDVHVTQLMKVLESKDSFTSVCERFIVDFVRPLGRDQSASRLLTGHILNQMGIQFQR